MFDYYNLMYEIYCGHLRLMYKRDAMKNKQQLHALWYELSGVLQVAKMDNTVSSDKYANMIDIQWHMYDIAVMYYCKD